jgi:hypothetical protein
MTARAPILRLEVGVSLRLDLRARAAPAGAPQAPPAFEVRELARDDVARVLGGSRALARGVDQLDAVAPAGWRCFAAFDRDTPVHVSFIALRAGGPLLFGAVSEPGLRGRGAFRAVMRHIAARLHDAGETTLLSSVAWRNRASLRAHAAAGFEVVARTADVFVLGVSLRAVARRLLRRRP